MHNTRSSGLFLHFMNPKIQILGKWYADICWADVNIILGARDIV